MAKGDADAYLKLVQVRQDRIRVRWRLAALAVVLLTLVVVAAWVWLPPAGQVVVLLTLVGCWAGSAPHRHPDHLSGRGDQPGRSGSPPTSSCGALGALGISLINQALAKGPGISFPAPIQHDGPGWRVGIDLPYGVTAVDIIERRRALASGLRRPLGCVCAPTSTYTMITYRGLAAPPPAAPAARARTDLNPRLD